MLARVRSVMQLHTHFGSVVYFARNRAGGAFRPIYYTRMSGVWRWVSKRHLNGYPAVFFHLNISYPSILQTDVYKEPEVASTSSS